MSTGGPLEEFRRDRGLLAGDDLAAWLVQAGIGEDEWVRRVTAGDTEALPGPLDAAPRPAVADRPAPLAGGGPPQVWADAPGTCGEAALRVVLLRLGVPPPAERILTSQASLAEIVAAARAFGVRAAASKVSRRRVADLPTPWIAHVDGGHWLVVHDVGSADVVVSDPGRGSGRLPRDPFLDRWSGWCAHFAPVVHCE